MKKVSFVKKCVDRMLPATIAMNLVTLICIMIDTALTGFFLGADALASVGMASPVIMIVIAIAAILASGNSVIVSNEVGKGDVDEASRVFSMTVFVAVGIALAATAIMLLSGQFICSMLGMTPGTDLYQNAYQYMIASVIVLPATAAVVVFPTVMQLEGESFAVFLALASLFVFDMLFDVLNLFVFHGGVVGMALASTLSYLVAAIILIFSYFKKKRTIKLSFKNVSFRRFKEVLSYGSTAFIGTLGKGVVSAVMNRLFLIYGSGLYVAAFTAVGSVGGIFLSAGIGMSQLTSTLTGLFYGEENREALAETIRVTHKKLLKINIILTLLAMVGAPLLLAPFINDPEVKGIAVMGLRLLVLQLIPAGCFNCFMEYLRGSHRVGAGNMFSILSSLAICLCAYLLVVSAGVDRLWLAHALAFAICIFIYLLYAGRLIEKVPLRAEDLTLEPESFGPRPCDMLEKNAGSIEDVTSFTAQVADFVISHGGSKRQAFVLPLCIEEMAGNVIRHGFADGKEHYFNVKVIAKEDGFLMRMRDDCKAFDPEEFYKMQNPESPEKNIGIRLVYQMAKSVTYTNALRLNNLIIKV